MLTIHCECYLPMIPHYEVQHSVEFQRIMFDEFQLKKLSHMLSFPSLTH